MKKLLLTMLFTSIFYFSHGSSGTLPYVSSTCGPSNTSNSQSVRCTISNNTTCNDSPTTFTFNNNTEFYDAFGSYVAHQWYLDGVPIGSLRTSVSSSIDIDPDNLSSGSHILLVSAKCSNYPGPPPSSPRPGTCTRQFYYNFEVSEFTPLPDFQVVMDDTVLPGNKNLQQNTSINMRVAGNNRGAEPCSPSTNTSRVRIWWTDRSSNVYSSADDILVLDRTIGVTKGTTINWETHNIGIPLISQFPSAGSFAAVRLIAEIDFNNTIVESNENNNKYVINGISIVNSSGGRMSEGPKELTSHGESTGEQSDDGPFKIVDLSGKTVWEKSSGVQLDYKELDKYKILVQFSRLNGEVTKEKIILN